VADANDDGKLSKAEFRDFAYDLGVATGNNADINEIFAIISNGSANKITVDQALTYFDQFKGTDTNWDETEFDAIVSRLEEGAPSVFSSLATDGKITTATITEQFNLVDTDGDSKLTKAEFTTFSANLGVETLEQGKFRTIAGSDKQMTLAELTGYANPFGTTASGTTTWDETQFDTVVSDLDASSGDS
jgi:Ca2+-binding EF-hand superfamily protein